MARIFVTGCANAQQMAADYDGEIMDFTSADWSAKGFVSRGCLAAVYDRLTAGDVLLIQYGRHDMDRENLACYSDPETEFAGYLERYVNVARNKRATPVFLIPALPGSEAWKESCCKLGKQLNVECVILPGQEGENT